MHPRNIAARNEDARRRIRTAAERLGDALGSPPLAAVTEQERRDRAVAHMRELETIADVLDQVAAALGDTPHGQDSKKRG